MKENSKKRREYNSLRAIFRTFFVFLIAALALSACSNEANKISIIENPASTQSKYPHLFSTGGELYMSWLQPGENGKATFNYAVYSNGGWSNVHTIAKGSSWFVNWADFPSVIAGKQGPLAAHWLDKIPGGPYAYNVNISVNNASRQWSPPIVPHSDGTATEHGFVSMIPWDETTILAVWLDGRQSAGDSPKEYFNIENAMTLRGALISTSGEVKERFLIDGSVCDCCQTSLVKTPSGALVAYRNRTENEIRDIYVSRFNGKNWSEPQVVHSDKWKIAACPVNGPQLAASDSLIAVVWPTAADQNPVVKAAVSRDEGRSFNKPEIVSKNNSLGRVDAAVYDGKVFVSWIEKTNEQAFLKLKRIEMAKTAPQTITISQINSTRATGFPQLEQLGDQLIMAWTIADSANSRIQTVKLNLPL